MRIPRGKDRRDPPLRNGYVDRLGRTYETHTPNHTRLDHTEPRFNSTLVLLSWYPATKRECRRISIN